MQPFLKWAGGKRWLTMADYLPMPQNYNRYIEPFLGGGAVFFHVEPLRSVLADINPELINLYQVLRDYPDQLMIMMRYHHKNHAPDYYYRIRSMVPRGLVAKAARTLYLNRTCWNGLYRVNMRGEFNVPIGSKSWVVLENEDFKPISNILKRAKIQCQDFSVTISKSKKGDFLFVDPPYTVKHNLNGFLKYNEKIFSWSDQLRLQKSLVSASKRGVSIVVTNADHESVRDLYKDFGYSKLERSSVLAASSSKRVRTTEALFFCNI